MGLQDWCSLWNKGKRRGKDESKSWPSGSVGCNIVQYTEMLWVRSSVKAPTFWVQSQVDVRMGGNWWMFLTLTFLSFSLSLSPSSSVSKINKYILWWGLKTKNEQIKDYSKFYNLSGTHQISKETEEK